MIKHLLLTATIVLTTSLAQASTTKNAYDFTFTSITGEALPLSNFEGKAILIVNTASRCGFTHQYADLQKVWEQYRERGLIVLGVPSNDFAGQEPGTEKQIKNFCEVNFNVDFPMTSKKGVTGDKAHPFYKWAATKFSLAAKPRWNFHKYLVAPDGALVDWFSTPTSPTSDRVTKAIEKVLPDEKISRADLLI